MKTKIGTSFGLALLLALGVIGAMLALGMFSSSKANADVDVTAVAHTPDKPGLASAFTITFTTATIGALAPGATITVVFDAAIQVPATIEKNQVVISASATQTTGGQSNPTLVVKDTCSAADVPNDACTAAGDHVVTLTLGDINPGDADQDGLSPVAGHKISFSSSAGIKNPLTANTAGAGFATTTGQGGGAHWIVVTTSDETVAESGANVTGLLTTPKFLSLSATSGGLGASVTLTGTGYVSGGTATVFLDGCPGTTNVENQVRDGTEPVIGTGTITDGAFTATFTADDRFQDADFTCTINAHDHLGNAIANSALAANDVTFTVLGSVTANKTSVTRGESISVTVAQYAAGAIGTVTFGGVQANLSGLTAAQLTPTAGALTMALTVPTSTPLGTQRLEVVGGSTRNANIEVVGAPVTLTPATAVPDQSITITGSGFTTGGAATVAVGSNTCAASGIVISGTVCWSGSHAATTIDNSGNLVLTFVVPDSATLHTAGTYELVITDSSNRTGSANLVIPSRTLTLSPAEGIRNSTVEFSGDGFPAKVTISVTYQVSSASTLTVATVTADSAGKFSGSFKVPNTAGIPSSNTVRASGTGAGGGATAVAVSKTATHKVSGATVKIAPASGPSGSTATVTGSGFPGFVSMSALNIDGISALPVPNPATDGDGNLTASVLIPTLSVGAKALLVTIGSGTSAVIASTDFTVTEAPVVAVVTTKATETVFAAEIASGSLTKVFAFNNQTKTYGFFDPREAFKAFNTYSTASSGDPVFANFTVDTTFEGKTYTAGWNIVVLK